MMSKLKYLLHAVAFIAIAIAAFALKSTKSYQRTNSDSSTVMIAKAERLRMNGDFKGASISYRRAIQRATSEQRAQLLVAIRRCDLQYIITSAVTAQADELPPFAPPATTNVELQSLEALSTLHARIRDGAAIHENEFSTKVKAHRPFSNWLKAQWYSSNKNIQKAAAALGEFLVAFPNHVAGHLLAYELNLVLGEGRTALRYLERYRQLSGDDVDIRLAQLHLELDNPLIAKEMLAARLQRGGVDAETVLTLARAHLDRDVQQASLSC